MTVLSAEHITVALSGSEILHEASFKVQSGELVGLVGPNGAGKTTMLRAMTRLLAVNSGSIEFDGVPTASMDHEELARRIAYLEQSSASYWPLTVESIVMLGRLPHLGQWRHPSERDWTFVRDAMRDCEVLQFSDRPVNTLSGGEQARVMLARAFATNPEFLLVDEPVAGLDPAHQLSVMDKLLDMVKNGAGVVVVMHDLTLAARYCTRLALMAEGRVVVDDSVEKVLSLEHLADVYGISAHLVDTEYGTLVVPAERLAN